MTFQEFWAEVTKPVANPDTYDIFGGGSTGYEEYFKYLGEQFKAAREGTVSLASAQKLGQDFIAMADRIDAIGRRLAAIPLPDIGDAEKAIKGRLNQIDLEMRYWGKQLVSVAGQGDVAAITKNAEFAFKQLGAAFALFQVGEAIYTSGGITNPSETANVMAQKGVGFFAGMWAGAQGGALAGAAAGLVTLNPIVIGVATVAGAIGGGYLGAKLGEGAWEAAYKEYLDKLPTLLDMTEAATANVQAWADRAQGYYGVLDGTWLTSSAANLPADQKVALTKLLGTMLGVPATASLDADLQKLFGADFGGDALVGRDVVVQVLLTYAKENAYDTERITVAEGGATLTLSLPSYPNTALSVLQDYLQGQLSEADQAGLSLTSPGRITLAVEAGELTGNSESDLLVGSGGADSVAGGDGDDVALAGGGEDSLSGGAGADVLFGGDGADTLDGGASGDYLYGGAGDDRYQLSTGELFDVITDSDGNGSIWVDGQQLTGGKKGADDYWISDDKQWGYLLTASGDLVISKGSSLDRITIRNWQSGGGNQLGITLDDSAASHPEPTRTFTGDYTKKVGDDGVSYVFDSDGNYASDGPQAGAADVLNGSSGKDAIYGLAGNDGIAGFADDDLIDGGAGDDLLLGGGGADTINGGDGNDEILGSADGAISSPGRTDFTPPPASGPEISRGFSWVIYDGGTSYLVDGGGSIFPDGETTGNVIDGGAGNDRIGAGRGPDVAHGGIGDDVIVGMGMGDDLFGDAGADLILGDGYPGFHGWSTDYSEHGADYIDAGEGNDTLLGQGGEDALYGGADDDLMYGDDVDADHTPLYLHANDYLDGEDGNDTLVGGGRDDVMFGGLGNDDLAGDAGDVPQGDDHYLDPSAHGNDYLDGEDGDDRLVGEGGADELFGGSGNDLLAGDGYALDAQYHGNDYLDGEDGADDLSGNGGDDTLYGGAGADVLRGDDSLIAGDKHGQDYLDGEAGNDTLVGDGGDDTLFGGLDDDVLRGDSDSGLAGQFHGNDYLDGEEGNDQLAGNGGNDTLFGGAGNDTLFGDHSALDGQYHGDDYLDGEDGTDQLVGGGGSDTLIGGEGDDMLFGDADDVAVSYHGNDYLEGGAGNDQLRGYGGNDTLEGGAGDDSLFGEAGQDILFGGAGLDQLQGGDDADLLSGEEGDDLLLGDAGDDTLYGGSDNDQLQGGDGNDAAFGEQGNDLLFGEAGNDWLEAGEGDDTLLGGDGDDTLVGGTGFDGLYGGTGNDTYVFGAGDTSVGMELAEFVNDTEGVNDIRLDGMSIGSMNLTPFTGFGGNDYLLETGQGSIFIRGVTSGAIGTFDVSGATYSANQFFGQTYAWSNDQTTSTAGAVLQGGKASDTLTSTGGGATLAGGAGDDTLVGSGGNNVYHYYLGDGADTITDTSSATQKGKLVFGAGILPEDLVLSYTGSTLVVTFGEGKPGEVRITGFNAADATGAAGVATFEFADGTVLTHAQLVTRGFDIAGTAASETVSGTNLVDRLTGGAGDDTLSGKAGADTYTFNVGDGADIIADGDTAAGSGDKLRFGEGIMAADVRALRNGNDVSLIIGSDQVTLKSYFAAAADTVENIEFADGTVWGQAEVLAAVTAGESQDWVITGDGGNNTLRGLGGNDLLDGRAGDDTIFGAAGNDTLVGGAGYDLLYGQAGGDTYVVAPNAYWDIIDERDGGDMSSVDTVKFEGGINRQDVSISASGNDISLQGGGSFVLVSGQFSSDSPANQVERFEFSDGTVMTSEEVKTYLLRNSAGGDWIPGFDTADDIAGGWGRDTLTGRGGADVLHGDEGDDQVYGDAGDDQVYGDAGDDTLYGGDGQDTLGGGTGRDRLDGGAGNDTYLFGAGQGMDIIAADASGLDTIQLAAGLSAANVTLHRVSSPPAADIAFKGDSLVVQINGGADQLWVANFFDAAAPGYVETIRFDDGTTWDYGAIVARLATLGGTVDTQTGTTKANTFTVDHWNDVINDPSYTDADKVNSSVSYRLPDAVNDLTLTGSLDLFALGGGMSDVLHGNAGDNSFVFAYSSSYGSYDTLAGGLGNDLYVVSASEKDVDTNANPLDMGGAVVSEAVGEGSDTLVSSFWSAQLPDNVEELRLGRPNATRNIYHNPYGYNDYTHRLIGNALDNMVDSTVYEELASSQDWAWVSTLNAPGGGYSTMMDFRLDGGSGADTLVGGQRNDTYVIDNAGDVVIETGVTRDGYDYSRNDTVETPFQTSLLTQFPNIENVTLVGSDAVNATGNAGNNRLDGARNSAANTLTGGAGNDTYVVGLGDVVVEQPDEGIDLVIAAAATGGVARLADYANVENLQLQAGAGDLNAEGDGLANQITGNSGQNRLSGGDGDDVVSDQSLDAVKFYYGTYAVADSDVLEGGAGNDVLYSHGGVDTLDGGAGDDTLYLRLYTAARRSTVIRFGLGDGHDAMVQDTASDVTIEFRAGIAVADVQVQRQNGYTTFTLADGSALDIQELDPVTLKFDDGMVLGPTQVEAMLRSPDRTTATELDDLLIGTAGADTISALGGNDAVYAGDGPDALDGGAGADLLLAGTGADTLTGGAGDDTLAGGTGADVYRFSRGFGTDAVDEVFTGGTAAGDDGSVDVVEFGADVATADVAVYRQVSGTTASGLVLALPSTGDSVALQHEYATGNAGAVELVRFADGTQWDLATMKSKISGEVGYDTNDTLAAPVTGARLEGRGGNDTLTGSSGNDVLDGGTGVDYMSGLGGNDTYYVDSQSDSVVEASRGGTDTVITSADNYYLSAEVERLEMVAGTSALRAIGNALANTMIGNAGDNRLDGGAGADSMSGGAGNDTYVVDATGDVVTEASDQGIDTIESAITVNPLGANVENLTLTGTSKISGTGNDLANVLIGNSAVNSLTGAAGNDRLDGGAGADSLVGGAGDDTYVVDTAGESVVESAGGGVDTVESSITWTLSAEVERLVLTGTSANPINGTGNASNNWLAGNDASNALNGGAGADVLLGGSGSDTLQDTVGNNALDGGRNMDTLVGGTGSDLLAGGAGLWDSDVYTLGGGADVVCFNIGDGSDTIYAPAAGSGAGETNDTISLGNIELGAIRMAKNGSDLMLKFHDTTNGVDSSLKIQGWYLSAANQTITKLQVIVDSSADYAPGTSDALRNSRVTTLNFTQLAAAYDAAKAANPGLGDWAPPEAALSAAQLSSSDSLAIGGNLSYRYAHDATLANVRYEDGIGQLASGSFGVAAQDILYVPGGAQAQAFSAQSTDVSGGAATDTASLAEPMAAAMASPANLATAPDQVGLGNGKQQTASPASVQPAGGQPSWNWQDWSSFQPAAALPQPPASPSASLAIADRWAQVDAWTLLQPALASNDHDGSAGETGISLEFMPSLNRTDAASLQANGRIENVTPLRLAQLA